MRRSPFAFICLLALAVSSPLVTRAADDQGPVAVPPVALDAGWRFHKGDSTDPAQTLDAKQLQAAVLASSAAFLVKEGPLPRPEPAVAATGQNAPYSQPNFNDADWQALDLPHDWAISGPFDQKLPGDTGKLPWVGVGWYRKHFSLEKSAPAQQTFLDIDGAMSHAAVWCNGQFVGGWPYGYASFRLNLTPFLNTDGENVLAVRLDNPPESSRWYPGAGIYRHVRLVKTAPLHVAHWGGAVETREVTADKAALNVQTVLDNDGLADAEASVQTKIFLAGTGAQTPRDLVVTTAPVTIKVPASARARTQIGVELPAPKLWDLEHPNLYDAVTEVSINGQIVDRHVVTFGVRTARFTAADGFLLNGKRVQIQGVCDHHDLGALGTAINETALRRQVTLLKEMGCNAIRTSHNPPAPELLDLCDRLGMLVMDESFDCWEKGKLRNDYHLLFADWHEKDQRALVRRDRNHPSIILWSIGNEVPDQGTAAGPIIARELTDIVHDEDGGTAVSRPTIAACNATDSGFNDFHKGLDVMGFNYKPTVYERFRQTTPTQPVLGSETASCVSGRGFFVFPVSDDKRAGRAEFQVSDYNFSAPSWAWPPDTEFKGLDEAPFTAGEFVWTGFDYLGEPTPYGDGATNLLNFPPGPERDAMQQQLKEISNAKPPARSSYFGIIDLAGFPKERFYLYQARWRPGLPMAHLTPHWTWPERLGQVTPVHVATSGDEAELFLNGQSLGRKKKGPLEYRLRWDDVKYAPGKLRVVAYKDGKEWATDEVKTAGAAAKLVLQAENPRLSADGRGLAWVRVQVTDAAGVLSPRAADRVRFSVTGPAEIVATDNGNAIDQEAFPSHERRAFSGRCLVILRAKAGASGKVTVRAEADGLQTGETELAVE